MTGSERVRAALAILREAHGDGHPDVAEIEAALQALD